MSNDDLLRGLNPFACGAASRIMANCPGTYLVSGVRDIMQQAEAMAQNCAQNPKWIEQTYLPSVLRDALQAAMDEGPSDPAETLYEVMIAFPAEDLRHLSWHLSGDAFDIAPSTNDGAIKFAENLIEEHVDAGGNPASKVLTKEGGLPRLHVQIA